MNKIRLTREEAMELEKIIVKHAKTSHHRTKHGNRKVYFHINGMYLMSCKRVANYIDTNNMIKLRPGIKITGSHISGVYRRLRLNISPHINYSDDHLNIDVPELNVDDINEEAVKQNLDDINEESAEETVVKETPLLNDNRLIDLLNRSSIATSLVEIASFMNKLLSKQEPKMLSKNEFESNIDKYEDKMKMLASLNRQAEAMAEAIKPMAKKVRLEKPSSVMNEEEIYQLLKESFVNATKREFLRKAPRNALYAIARRFANRMFRGKMLTHDLITLNLSRHQKQALLMFAVNIVKNSR